MADWSDFPVVPSSGWDAFPIVAPADTGQGYVSSLVNSAGRGFARVLADVPGGLGYLTGSDTLVQWGDDIEAGINEALPVNPIYADDFAMKAAGAVGQAGSMLATGGIGGTMGKGLALARGLNTSAQVLRSAQIGAEVAALGSGFLAGARGGGQAAEEYGMDGGAAYARILAGGAIELATEKLLFGMGAETRAMRRMLGETVEGGWGRFTKDVLTEGGEEWTAEVGNNAATMLLAPPGVQTPGVFDNSLEAGALGMVGGAVFGGVNAWKGRGETKAPATMESGELPLRLRLEGRGFVPGPPARTQIAEQPFYFDGLQWNKLRDPSTVSASPELEPPFIPLNPANPIEGPLIMELENRRRAVMLERSSQSQGHSAEEATQASLPPPSSSATPSHARPASTEEGPVSEDTNGAQRAALQPSPAPAAAGEAAQTWPPLPDTRPESRVTAADETSWEHAPETAGDAEVDATEEIWTSYDEGDLSTWPLTQTMRDRAQAALDVLEEAGYALDQLETAVADPAVPAATQRAAQDLLELRKQADARWGVAHARMTSLSALPIQGIDKAVSENQNANDEPADSTFKSFRFQPVGDEALAEREREALNTLRKSEGNPGIGAARTALPESGLEQGTAPTAFLGSIKEVFGKDVLFVHPGGGGRVISFEGVSIPGQRNTIVLDATSKSPVLYLTGHELTHALKEQRPELWDRLRDELLTLAGDWSDYRQRLRNLNYQDHQLVDEFLGDVVGGQFRERAFWEKLEKRNPSLFRRLATAALQFLNRILGKVGGLSRDVRGYFADIEAARDVIADVLEQYAAARHFPDRTLIEGDDADLVRAARVDKRRRGPNLLRANLSPQQPGSNAAVDALRRSLQAVESEVQNLGAQIEEIDSAEAARRGYPASLTLAVTPDGKKLVFVTDKLVGQSLPQAVADAVVREEVIHLGWLSAMRAEYQRTGSYLPFDSWLEMELTGWVNELSASPTGEQMLLDVANLYDQPQPPYATVQEALQGFAGRETLLIHELARQIVQLRESGEITESVIAKAIHKLREWFTAALQRLKAMATDVTSVSPTLEAVIAETERILRGLGGSVIGPGPATSSLPPIPANLSQDRVDFHPSEGFNVGDGNLRARPTVSEDFYDQSAKAAFERRVRERQGALRAELSEEAVEVTEALQTQERRAAVTITDRGDITLSIRDDFARSIFNESRGNTELAEDIVEATLGEERLHVATLQVWREDWAQAGRRGSFRDYVRGRAVSLLSDMRGSIEKLPQNLQDQSRQAVFLAWQTYFDPGGVRTDVTPQNILEKLTDFVEVERIAQTPGSFVLELTRQLMQVKADGVTTETVFDSIVAPLLELGRRVLAHLRKALNLAEGGQWGEVLRDLIAQTEAVLASGSAPFQPQGHRGRTEDFSSRDGGTDGMPLPQRRLPTLETPPLNGKARSLIKNERGDRNRLVKPEGWPPRQTDEFDRSSGFDEPVRSLFEALQERAQALATADGQTIVHRPMAASTAEVPHALSADYQADGTITLRGDAQSLAADLLAENQGDRALALAQAEAVMAEELWHVAQLVAMRNDWIQAGRPGSFETWVDERSEEIMQSLREAVTTASVTEATKIKAALFAAWEMYFAPSGHTETADSVFNQLTHPMQSGQLAPRADFLAEFTRQLHQAGVTGETTETAGLLKRLQDWVRKALKALKQAYHLAKGGALGQPLKELMERTEAVLEGREVALPNPPGQPRGHGRSFNARWAPQPIPPGVTAQEVEAWRAYLHRKRVQNPVYTVEVVRWQDQAVPTGQSLSGNITLKYALQSMLDLIPREVMESVCQASGGYINFTTVPTLEGGKLALFDPNTQTIQFSRNEYDLWKSVDDHRPPHKNAVLPQYLRDAVWHEMTHWLYLHANSHPRLQVWRHNLEQHWQDRTAGVSEETDPDGSRYLDPGWIKRYAGRWYPDHGWGQELPTVYLEEMSYGPERVAEWCRDPRQVSTFKIAASLFGPL